MSFNLVLFIIFLLFQLNLHSTTKAEENSAFNADSKSQPILRTNNDTNTTVDIDSTTTDNTTLNNTNATITTTPTNINTTLATPTNISTTIATPNNTNTTIATPTNINTTLATPNNISTTITTPNHTNTTIATPSNISTTITTPANISSTITTPNNISTTITTPNNTNTTITTPTNINSTITTPNNTNTTITTPSNISTTTTATTHTTTTTSSPNLNSLNVCDFSNISCIASGAENVDITDGRKFAEDIDGDITQPPKGPVSSAESVLEPAVNNEPCHIPYNMSIFLTNASANWNMYFCYKDLCLSANNDKVNCSSGTYGLVHFAPNETNKTITMSVKQNARYLAQVNVQSLHYYYYISNSNDTLDWNKTIEVYINNETRPIDTVTTANMRTNGWEKGTANITASTDIYNISFKFKVVNINSTKTPSNESIYFALDNIKLVSSNGSYAPENNTNGSTPTMVSTTTSTVSSPSNEPDIPLILGLTLGLGIPLILVTIAFIGYYVRVHTRGKQYHKDSAEFDIPRIYSTDRYDGDNQILTTIF
ncbi:unnamed protein product [Adineta steineri]|uniref:Uncharacterized protein n=1 Tax=Adineta steineri TaxID=433720 RepID=A0A813RCL2_9BILA|nr:unnamed protein product [Adineta steineri]CAF4071905.1 unnamed protein product [Adineta steineri]